MGQVEAVQFGHDPHIKRCGDVTIFTVAMNSEVVVVAAKEDVSDHPFIGMEGKDNWFVLGEDLVKFFITQAPSIHTWMAEFQDVHYINKADLELREGLVQDGDSSQGFLVGLGTCCSKDDIWFFISRDS